MKSDPANVLSGILQGIFLGPIISVIYINDLPEVAKCGSYLFIDDTKIFRQIATKEDPLQLQSDINSLEQWSQQWPLTFHPKNAMPHWETFIALAILRSTPFIDNS